MPQGTPVEVTTAAVRELEASARRMKAELDEEFDVDGESVVKHVLASVGEQPSSARRGAVELGAPVGGSHLGEVSIELQGGDVRPIAAREVAQRWREATPPIPDVEELTFTLGALLRGRAHRHPAALAGRRPAAPGRRAAEGPARRVPGRLRHHRLLPRRQGGDQALRSCPRPRRSGLTLDDLAAPGAPGLLRRGGPAHPARPRRRARDGALPGEPAALARPTSRTCASARPRAARCPSTPWRAPSAAAATRPSSAATASASSTSPPTSTDTRANANADPGGAAGGLPARSCWPTTRA